MSEWQESQRTDTHDFSVNPEIVGILLRVREEVGPNKSKLYELEVGDKVIGVWGASVLDTKMSNVKVGEEVKIIFNGITVSDITKRKYKDYSVFHRKAENTEVFDGTLPEFSL